MSPNNGNSATEAPPTSRREDAAKPLSTAGLGEQFDNGPRDWHRSLATAIRDVDTLFDRLSLPDHMRGPARRAAGLFPLMVPESYLRRMTVANPDDPLLRQVLPLDAELDAIPGYVVDAVGDNAARRAPGLLHKYQGRALMIATGSCAVHCRYCFRRQYPYGEEPRRLEEWEPALAEIAQDASLHEVILSGGDPLMLTDVRLKQLIARIDAVPHVRRLRIHTRLPVVLPDRMTAELIDFIRSTALAPIVVVHANHPAEIVADCADALRFLVRSGIPTLNQAVLLRRVNDDVDVLADLCERLVDLGVMPYYLHQLDRVEGTAHFAVDDHRAVGLVDSLRSRLPGYAVPRLVREIPGAPSKMPITVNRCEATAP
ncbi:MAG: EF-P beta-lysylation protein EpmB [Planctomycetaceae bacterium]|nr:EF-P beta-lysylation protein EpmB [Planctomycetaceae bacterium]